MLIIVVVIVVMIPMGKEGALCRHNGSLRSISTITMIYHDIQPRLHLHNVHFISSTYILRAVWGCVSRNLKTLINTRLLHLILALAQEMMPPKNVHLTVEIDLLLFIRGHLCVINVIATSRDVPKYQRTVACRRSNA